MGINKAEITNLLVLIAAAAAVVAVADVEHDYDDAAVDADVFAVFVALAAYAAFAVDVVSHVVAVAGGVAAAKGGRADARCAGRGPGLRRPDRGAAVRDDSRPGPVGAHHARVLRPAGHRQPGARQRGAAGHHAGL